MVTKLDAEMIRFLIADKNATTQALNQELRDKQDWCRVARELGRMLIGRVPDNYYSLSAWELLKLVREKTHDKC